jgi:hypothetical protein
VLTQLCTPTNFFRPREGEERGEVGAEPLKIFPSEGGRRAGGGVEPQFGIPNFSARGRANSVLGGLGARPSRYPLHNFFRPREGEYPPTKQRTEKRGSRWEGQGQESRPNTPTREEGGQADATAHLPIGWGSSPPFSRWGPWPDSPLDPPVRARANRDNNFASRPFPTMGRGVVVGSW